MLDRTSTRAGSKATASTCTIAEASTEGQIGCRRTNTSLKRCGSGVRSGPRRVVIRTRTHRPFRRMLPSPFYFAGGTKGDVELELELPTDVIDGGGQVAVL